MSGESDMSIEQVMAVMKDARAKIAKGIGPSVILMLQRDWDVLKEHAETSVASPQEKLDPLGSRYLGIPIEVFATEEELEQRKNQLLAKQIADQYSLTADMGRMKFVPFDVPFPRHFGVRP